MTEPNAGESTCPICNRRWLVTPNDDCLMPACGCFGHETGPANPSRLCERCGLSHAKDCDAMEKLHQDKIDEWNWKEDSHGQS